MKLWLYTFSGNACELPRGWNVHSIHLDAQSVGQHIAVLTQEVGV